MLEETSRFERAHTHFGGHRYDHHRTVGAQEGARFSSAEVQALDKAGMPHIMAETPLAGGWAGGGGVGLGPAELHELHEHSLQEAHDAPRRLSRRLSGIALLGGQRPQGGGRFFQTKN